MAWVLGAGPGSGVAPKDDCKIMQLAAVTRVDEEKAMITSTIRIAVDESFTAPLHQFARRELPRSVPSASSPPLG